MKKIFKIALTELRTLFCSPVAWLILIVFTFQAAMAYMDMVFGFSRAQEMNGVVEDLTMNFFGGKNGLFSKMLDNLYLYIPLLTMGLMSRELSSGSIKLLYSSPVTNVQIILGKYLSMMIYGLILIAILSVFCIHASFIIKDFDTPVALAGLLGIYLLVCTYASIGLFMSSLTSYQVVAAIGTLATLSVLNFVGRFGRDIDLVRDITYWLSISGRADESVNGLIASDDMLYFLIVTCLFIALCILRLNANRQKTHWSVAMFKYLGVFAMAIVLGYITSRPTMKAYADVTRTKKRSLTKASQDIVAQMKGGLTITTYVNALDEDYRFGLPRSRNGDIERFQQFIRFKPEIRMEYVYYYKSAPHSLVPRADSASDKERLAKMCSFEDLNPKLFMGPDQIDRIIDLAPENYHLVRKVERESGEWTFLRMYYDMWRYPSEAEIAAAFKRLVMDLPLVGFATGHGERSCEDQGDSGYYKFTQDKTLRQSLVNQGFAFTPVALDQPVPERVSILVISDMREPMTPQQEVNLDAYIARGGNLLVMGEPRRYEVMKPLLDKLGVSFVPGRLVDVKNETYPGVILSRVLPAAAGYSDVFDLMIQRRNAISMPEAAGLAYTEEKGFRVEPLMATDSTGCWNEMESFDFSEQLPVLNPAKGEAQRSYPTILGLSRPVEGREQKILVVGDADCLSNGEMGTRRSNMPALNYNLVMGAFGWLSDGEVPIDVKRPTPPDNEIHISREGVKMSRVVFMIIFPSALLALFLFIWIRRRSK